MRHAFRSRILRTKALALCTLLIFLPHGFGQTSALSGAIAPMALYINILEGQDALNNIRDRTAREPIVQVTDENHQPVKGATVTFTDVAGTTGAAGSFGGLVTYQAITDQNGKAVGRGFRPNNIAGKHEIEVAAAAGMLIAAIVIHENNVIEGLPILEPGTAAAGRAGLNLGFIAGFAAAASAVGTYLGVKSDADVPAVSSGTTTGTTTTTVTTTTTSVPEIDLSMTFGCLVFLAGAVAVLRGR